MENVQAYIESGILEAYVAGMLSESECLEIDTLATKHPAIKQEIAAIQEASRAYASSFEGAKPPALRMIKQHLAKEATKNISLPPRSSSHAWQRYALAACIALLLASVGMNLWLNQKVNLLSQEVNDIQQINNYIVKQYEANKVLPRTIEASTRIMENPSNILIAMDGTEVSEEASATVVWDPGTFDVYIQIHQLPPPPDGHQYQLWAIYGDTSIDAGIFEHHLKMQKLRNIRGNVTAFAVTLEVIGGSPTPNLNRMYTVGKLPA